METNSYGNTKTDRNRKLADNRHKKPSWLKISTIPMLGTDSDLIKQYWNSTEARQEVTTERA